MVEKRSIFSYNFTMKNRLWKNWFLLLLGLWIMILPWTGFPQEVKTPLTVLSGFCVLVLSFVLARPTADEGRAPTQEQLFSEDTFPEDTDGN